MLSNTGFSIINLREAGEVKLLFPSEITTEDRANWDAVDVIGKLKPLLFGNVEPQQIRIDDLCLDYTHKKDVSVEPEIATLRSWMRSDARNGSPPPLLIVTTGWQQRAVLSQLTVKRSFFTNEGVCIRAFFSLAFDELPANGLQMDVTPRRRSGNSISGKT